MNIISKITFEYQNSEDIDCFHVDDYEMDSKTIDLIHEVKRILERKDIENQIRISNRKLNRLNEKLEALK